MEAKREREKNKGDLQGIVRLCSQGIRLAILQALALVKASKPPSYELG